jgi:hypothetical protein
MTAILKRMHNTSKYNQPIIPSETPKSRLLLSELRVEDNTSMDVGNIPMSDSPKQIKL